MNNVTTVPLTAHEQNRAEHFAGLRRWWNKEVKGNADAPHLQNQNFRISGVYYETVSILCEYGVVKYLELDPNNCDWCKFSTNPADYKRPDILNIIDVRSVTHPTNPLVVETKDVAAGAIIVKTHIAGQEVVDGKLMHNGSVQLLGWEYADIAWMDGCRNPRDRSGKSRNYVEPLRPMEDLAVELEKLGKREVTLCA